MVFSTDKFMVEIRKQLNQIADDFTNDMVHDAKIVATRLEEDDDDALTHMNEIGSLAEMCTNMKYDCDALANAFESTFRREHGSGKEAATGWGLSLTEGLMAGNMIIAPVQGGMQDQMRFEDENGDWINFTSEHPTNSNGKYRKHGEWAIPMWPKTRSLKGSPQTPYIYASQVDIEDAGLGLLSCYQLGRKEIQRRGLKGREWLLSEESSMTAKGMGENFINYIKILFEKWTPIEKYTIEKVTDGHSTYNHNSVQYTPEFEQKLKEVLK